MLVPSALLTIKQNELHFKETYKRPKTRRLALAVRTSSVVHTMQWMVIHNVENNFVLSIRHVEAATKNLCMFKKLSRCSILNSLILSYSDKSFISALRQDASGPSRVPGGSHLYLWRGNVSTKPVY